MPSDLPKGTGTVLVVDDDPLVLNTTSHLLQRLGYTVKCASSGEAAIDHVKLDPPDLIILDLVMEPGIDGVETFRRIHSVRPEQKAMILSGYAYSSRLQEARELGIQQCLSKPVDLHTLAQAVRRELAALPN